MPGFNIQAAGGCGSEVKCGGGYTGPKITEAARRHRYRLFVLEPVKPILLYAYKCGRPTPEVDKMMMHQGQDEIAIPGKNRWLPLEITFYEVVEDDDQTAKYLYEWWAESMIDIRSSRVLKAAKYKKRCELVLTDGCGMTIWTYKMYDVWPSKVSPSDLAYTDTELAEIAVTLEIGKATEEK